MSGFTGEGSIGEACIREGNVRAADAVTRKVFVVLQKVLILDLFFV